MQTPHNTRYLECMFWLFLAVFFLRFMSFRDTVCSVACNLLIYSLGKHLHAVQTMSYLRQHCCSFFTEHLWYLSTYPFLISLASMVCKKKWKQTYTETNNKGYCQYPSCVFVKVTDSLAFSIGYISDGSS